MTTRTRICLGTFTMGRVCLPMDPCGEVDRLPCRPGTYRAFVRTVQLGSFWGLRVMELEIVHEGANQELDRDVRDLFAATVVGVDSGQAGFFDYDLYSEDSYSGGDDEDSEDFYERCCNLAFSGAQGGVLPGGVVSSSGLGDGGYQVFTDVDPSVAPISFARLVFLEEDAIAEKQPELGHAVKAAGS